MLSHLKNNRQKITITVVGIILYFLLANSRSLDNNSFVEFVFGLKLIVPAVFGILFGGRIGAIVGALGAAANGIITGNSLEFVSIIGNIAIGASASGLTNHFMAPITALSLVPGYALHLAVAWAFGFINSQVLMISRFWASMFLWLFANICGVTIAIRLYRMCFHYEGEKYVKQEKKNFFTSDKKIWAIVLVVFVLLTAVITALFYFEDILITFVIGAALILLAERIKGEYQERMIHFGISERRRKIYGYLLLVFWLIITIALFWSSINQINSAVAEGKANSADITNTYIENLRPYTPKFLAGYILSRENVVKAEEYLLSLSSKFLAHVGIFVFNSILIIPLLFFLYFRKKDTLMSLFYSYIPKKYHGPIVHASKDMGKDLHSFFSGKVIESLAIAVICALGFFIAGLNGWLLLGFIAGFFNVVPYIGPIIGAIPPILLALLDGPTTAWYVIITVIIAQLIDNFYFQPFMITKKVKIDPLLSIILILAGAKLFGILGMVFAIPVFIVYKVILIELYGHLYNMHRKKSSGG